MENIRRYIFSLFSLLLIFVGLFAIIFCEHNGLTVLMYIFPMFLETAEETVKKKNNLFEKIIDIVGLLMSFLSILTTVVGMITNQSFDVNEWLLYSYPFYKGYQTIHYYVKKEE